MRKLPIYILTLSLALLVPLKIKAQTTSKWDGIGIETNLFGGQIIKHSKKFTAPIPAFSSGIDVNIIWQTYGKKNWHKSRGYPAVGVGLTYTDYGNDAVFGQCVGIYTDLQIPLVRGKNLEWTMRIGDGIGYVTRKHGSPTAADTINTAIGSHINDFAILLTDLRYHINRHWDIQAGANFTHISNAGFKSPNLGVNMVGGHLGIRYFPATSAPKRMVADTSILPNRWLAQARAGISFKEARAAGKPIKPAYLGAVYVSRRWLGKNKAFTGIDYAYHEDVYAFLKNYGVREGNEKANSWDGGIFAGNEFLVGRIGIMMQVGMYYHQTYLKFDDVYEKLGGNLYLIKKEHGALKELFVSALLNTHGAVAEYCEFGLGVGL